MRTQSFVSKKLVATSLIGVISIFSSCGPEEINSNVIRHDPYQGIEAFPGGGSTSSGKYVDAQTSFFVNKETFDESIEFTTKYIKQGSERTGNFRIAKYQVPQSYDLLLNYIQQVPNSWSSPVSLVFGGQGFDLIGTETGAAANGVQISSEVIDGSVVLSNFQIYSQYKSVDLDNNPTTQEEAAVTTKIRFSYSINITLDDASTTNINTGVTVLDVLP